MRRLWAGMIAAASVAGCRTPTQIDVIVDTNLPCASIAGTAVTVGELGEIETIPSTSTSTTCTNGHLGSIVLIPSGSDGALVAFKIVTAIDGENIDQCVPDDAGSYGASCIVARRALRYIPNKSLQVDVLMSGECAGTTCDPFSTCVEGTCVSATITNPSQCEGNGCDESVLEPDGGLPPITDSGIVDATTRDATLEDASVDAPGPAEAAAFDGAVPACDLGGLAAGAPWPMQGYCPSGRNRGPLVGPDAGPSYAWTQPLLAGAIAAPSLGANGILYQATVGGGVKAFLATDGGLVWSYPPAGSDAGQYQSEPALSADGRVWAFDFGDGVSDGIYSTLDPSSGAPFFEVTTLPGVRSVVTIVSGGTVYVGDTDRDLVALLPDGGQLWLVPNVATDYSFPTVGSDGTIFVNNGGSNLLAFHPDGGQSWSTSYDASAMSPAEIAVDGTLRAFSFEGVLYSLEAAQGSILWQQPVPGGSAYGIQGLAISDDGTTYVGVTSGLYAYGSDGGTAGSMTGQAVGEPAIDANGDVYAIYGSELASFDRSCNLRWHVVIPGYLGYPVDAPVLGPGGTIYVVSNDQGSNAILVAFGPAQQ